jgi:hypothetical protein
MGVSTGPGGSDSGFNKASLPYQVLLAEMWSGAVQVQHGSYVQKKVPYTSIGFSPEDDGAVFGSLKRQGLLRGAPGGGAVRPVADGTAAGQAAAGPGLRNAAAYSGAHDALGAPELGTAGGNAARQRRLQQVISKSYPLLGPARSCADLCR